jgi:hypothetical protein
VCGVCVYQVEGGAASRVLHVRAFFFVHEQGIGKGYGFVKRWRCVVLAVGVR